MMTKCWLLVKFPRAPGATFGYFWWFIRWYKWSPFRKVLNQQFGLFDLGARIRKKISHFFQGHSSAAVGPFRYLVVSLGSTPSIVRPQYKVVFACLAPLEVWRKKLKVHYPEIKEIV